MNTSANSGSQLVILHQSLNESEIHRNLKTHQFKIKVSTGTLRHTCIFPQSTAAFMILPTTEVFGQTKSTSSIKHQINPDVAMNLKKFSELRHKSYVFLSAPLIGVAEQNILSLLQEEYIGTDLQFLPAHNSSEITECMFSISKVMCKPLSDVIRERFERLCEQVCCEENVLRVLAELGVDERTSTVLLDGCGGLAGLVRATRRGELSDYNVNASVIASIEEILNTKPGH